jgi:tRNA(Ile)-lysidine synthase
MPNMLQSVESAWPPELWRDVHVLVATSGGPDSMAVLRAILEIKRRDGGRGAVLAAHVHHGLHPAADDDQAWLSSQMEGLGVPLTAQRVNTHEAAARQGDGLEAAARSLRYAALQTTAEHLGARYVVTGHTADDQVETVLHRILRGTGIEGLAGIRRHRPLGNATTLVRPLLDVTRKDVLEYLAAIGQPFRQDPTNEDAAFTRNRIRCDLLPLLRSQYNASAGEAILRLARQAQELNLALQDRVGAVLQASCDIAEQQITVDSVSLRGEPEPLAREVFRSAWRIAGWPEQEMDDASWRRLTNLLNGDSTRVNLPGLVEAVVSRDAIRLFRQT